MDPGLQMQAEKRLEAASQALRQALPEATRVRLQQVSFPDFGKDIPIGPATTQLESAMDQFLQTTAETERGSRAEEDQTPGAPIFSVHVSIPQGFSAYWESSV